MLGNPPTKEPKTIAQINVFYAWQFKAYMAIMKMIESRSTLLTPAMPTPEEINAIAIAYANFELIKIKEEKILESLKKDH